MNQALIEAELHEILDFDQVTQIKTIQSLWSGYGELLRINLSGAKLKSVIVKYISPPSTASHPRGWNTPAGHARKLKSYQVEAAWYRNYNQLTDASCRTANFIGFVNRDSFSLLVLENLATSEYPLLKPAPNSFEIENCIDWLAAFHVKFMSNPAIDLWSIGTYWQLETRQLEFDSMPQSTLKTYASAIHHKLENCAFKTILHGDAKFANFCFSTEGKPAAVDFQYTGIGCGIKDVMYLMSGIKEELTEERAAEFLDYYFQSFKKHATLAELAIDFNALETEWRQLYPFAWADFVRFLQGWSPDHWKINQYALDQVELALKQLERQ